MSTTTVTAAAPAVTPTTTAPKSKKYEYLYFDATSGYFDAIKRPLHNKAGEFDLKSLVAKIFFFVLPLLAIAEFTIGAITLPITFVANLFCGCCNNEAVAAPVTPPARRVFGPERAPVFFGPEPRPVGFVANQQAALRAVINTPAATSAADRLEEARAAAAVSAANRPAGFREQLTAAIAQGPRQPLAGAARQAAPVIPDAPPLGNPRPVNVPPNPSRFAWISNAFRDFVLFQGG